MWLVVVNLDNKNGVVSEYDILLNTDQIKEIRPKRDGTCMVMYSDPEQNLVVKHGLDYFMQHVLETKTAKLEVDLLKRGSVKEPFVPVFFPDETPKEEKKDTKLHMPKGTTSAAINQG